MTAAEATAADIDDSIKRKRFAFSLKNGGKITISLKAQLSKATVLFRAIDKGFRQNVKT